MEVEKQLKQSILTGKFKQKGFTLIETLIVVAVMGVVTAAVTTLFTQGFHYWSINRTQVELQRDVRALLDLMLREIKEAKTNSVEINSFNNSQPPCSKINFTTIDGREVSFYQKGKQIFVENSNGTTLLANNLRVLSFIYPDTSSPDIINISICAEANVYGTARKTFYMSIEKVRIMNE